MQYIVHNRFKDSALCGPVNLKATSQCWEADGVIFYEAQPLCYATSENAFEHFARNDDGNGMFRGQLTRTIKKRLAKRDAQYQERWDKVWADDLCLRFKRAEFDDFWVWNKAFYDAGIEELEHIAKLVGTEVKR